MRAVRQCEQCGYLLPEAWETCKRCGTAVTRTASVPAVRSADRVPVGEASATPAPPAAWAGPSPVRAIGDGFDPRYSAPVRVGFPGDGAPTVADRPDVGGWQPPPIRPPARANPLRPAIVAIAVVAVIVAGGWFAWQRLRAEPALPAEAVSYIEGAGVAYEPFNQGYRVRLPRAPLETTGTVDQGGVSVTYSEAYVEHEGRYEIHTGAADLPIVVPAEVVNELLSDAATSAVAAALGSELLEQEHTQFAGRPALDAKLEAPDGHPARVLVVLDGSHIVAVFTHATSRNDDLFEAVTASLELTR
jgi:hypothetical protein